MFAGGEVVVLEDVQRLADGGAARRRRRHAVDVEAAVLHVRRVLLDHLVAGDVVGRHDARDTRGASAPGSVLRILHDVGDLVGDADRRRTRRCRAARSAASVIARSRFLKIEPTCGASPPGRNSSAVSGNAAKRAWLSSVWSRKVWSTVNPFVGEQDGGLQRCRGATRCRSGRARPPRSRACRARRPRGPTTRRRRTGTRHRTASWRDTLPGITKASLGMSAGAVSRPSIVVTSPVAASKYTK